MFVIQQYRLCFFLASLCLFHLIRDVSTTENVTDQSILDQLFAGRDIYAIGRLRSRVIVVIGALHSGSNQSNNFDDFYAYELTNGSLTSDKLHLYDAKLLKDKWPALVAKLDSQFVTIMDSTGHEYFVYCQHIGWSIKLLWYDPDTPSSEPQEMKEPADHKYLVESECTKLSTTEPMCFYCFMSYVQNGKPLFTITKMIFNGTAPLPQTVGSASKGKVYYICQSKDNQLSTSEAECSAPNWAKGVENGLVDDEQVFLFVNDGNVITLPRSVLSANGTGKQVTVHQVPKVDFFALGERDIPFLIHSKDTFIMVGIIVSLIIVVITALTVFACCCMTCCTSSGKKAGASGGGNRGQSSRKGNSKRSSSKRKGNSSSKGRSSSRKKKSSNKKRSTRK